jgi:hypothetical protein
MLKGIYHPRVQYPEAPGKRTTDDQPTATDDRIPTTNGKVPSEVIAVVRAIPDEQNGTMGNIHAVGTNGLSHNEIDLGSENGRPSSVVGPPQEEVAHE